MGWGLTVLLAACSGQEPAVSPEEGPTAGGFAVRIEGDDFIGHGPPMVFFGERPAKKVVVESDRLIRVRSPQMEKEGVVSVTVQYQDGTVHEYPEAFRYIGANVVQLPEG